MSVTRKQLAANIKNSQKSTGPATPIGKARSSGNAVKHGVLSGKLTLPGENVDTYQQLHDDLNSCLRPVGALELATVEKIAINLWRQRRLIQAETAEIHLQIQPERIAHMVTSELMCHKNPVTVPQLENSDKEHSDWYDRIKDEFQLLATLNIFELDWSDIEKEAPRFVQFLEENADRRNLPLNDYVERICGGFDECLELLEYWCDEIHSRHNDVLQLAELMRIKNRILQGEVEQKFMRYQTTLNNDYHKLNMTLREQRKMRSHFIEGESVTLKQETAPEVL